MQACSTGIVNAQVVSEAVSRLDTQEEHKVETIRKILHTVGSVPSDVREEVYDGLLCNTRSIIKAMALQGKRYVVSWM